MGKLWEVAHLNAASRLNYNKCRHKFKKTGELKLTEPSIYFLLFYSRVQIHAHLIILPAATTPPVSRGKKEQAACLGDVVFSSALPNRL